LYAQYFMTIKHLDINTIKHHDAFYENDINS
jgi:hypothetical protein